MEQKVELCNIIVLVNELNEITRRLNELKNEHGVDLANVRAAVQECNDAVGEAIVLYSSQHEPLPF